ncbi:hypothetical protein ACFL5V_03230 [Fibrobacterota bacterium]
MLWNPDKTYCIKPFEKEAELEEAILKVSGQLFGVSRIYLDVKKRIGVKGKTRNIPDGYLIDLSSKKEPRLYLVENELAKHEPLKHIAVQILEFSLSFETSPQKVKSLIKDALSKDKKSWEWCESYALENGFENVDYLLETMVYSKEAFNALVIIDEIPDDLETVLMSRFKFPVEIISLQRFESEEGEELFQFEPFLSDLTEIQSGPKISKKVSKIDPSDFDTIVVPAREEGFDETFLGENRWYKIRIHGSMIPKIKYIAAYRVAPESSITHIAKVESIKQWPDSNKYVLNFAEPAKKIRPIKLVPKGRAKAPQAPRYTTYEQIQKAKNLDDVF